MTATVAIDDWLRDALGAAGWTPRAVHGLTADLLSAGRGFTGTVHRLAAPDAPPLILKHPASDPSRRERAVREIAFLRRLDELDPERTLVCARLIEATDENDVRLLLEPIDGEPGDVEHGASPDRLAAVIDAATVLHRLPINPEDPPPWAPRWGSGQAQDARPHQRRAARYAKRLAPFLAWWEDACPPAFRDLLFAIETDAESILTDAAEIGPAVLIHGDLHLDNVIFTADDRAVLLDWQSVSLGPAAYDIARVLAEAVDDPAEAARLVERARRALDAPASFAADVGVMLRATVIGFVCGYGGRDPADMHPRERRMIDVTLRRRLGRLAPAWPDIG